ncbi:hypothetical protein J4Q44_G00339230, partial [Coregonus suidteri]
MTALERKRGRDLRGQQVFLRPDETSALTLTDRLQDALLRLAAVVDVHSLRDALRETVQGLLPSVVR